MKSNHTTRSLVLWERIMGETIAEHGKLIGLCAWNGSEWVKIVADDNDFLKVSIVNALAALEVEQDTPGDLLTGQHHFDGSLWRKSNLLWGYHAIWDENLTGTVDGTSYTKDTGVIPANELWVLQTVSIANADHASSAAYIYITRASGAVLHLAYKDEPPVWDPLIFEGSFIMRTGDVITVLISGCTNGDSIRAGILGYKMDIEM